MFDLGTPSNQTLGAELHLKLRIFESHSRNGKEIEECVSVPFYVFLDFFRQFESWTRKTVGLEDELK